MNLKKFVNQFILWRLLLILFTIPAAFLLPLKPGFTQQTPHFSFDNLILLYSNFDGQKYLNLSQYDYGHPITKDDNFLFPFYPWLIENFNIFNSPLITAIIISHTCLFLALIIIYKTIKIDYDDITAFSVLRLILIFPTAFFLISVYSESLFLLLSVSCFYFARKKNYLLASAIAGLASYTRLMGLFLFPFLLIEFWIEHKKNVKLMLQDYRIISLLLAPLGLINYLKLLEIKTGNALSFLYDKPLFNPDRIISKVILLYQVLFRYLKMIIFIDHTDPLFFTVLLEFSVGIIFLVLVIISFRQLRLSYAFYSLFLYLIPTLNGSFISLPRYVIIIFPLFIILAKWYQHKSNKIQAVILILCLILSFISISLFSRGYFIS